MTIDEYANLERKNGTKLIKTDGIWWREIIPFFFRPLFPFVKILAGSAKPPSTSILVGYQHLVPNSEMANSYMNFLVFDDICNYSIQNLSHDYRKNIRKGLKRFEVRQVNDFEEFVAQGHRVYTSFYERTRYSWKKDRNNLKTFEQWSRSLFDFAKVLILGAYCRTGLSAIGICYLVEDIIMYATFFSNDESLKLRVSEVMLHTIREMASKSQSAKYIYMGLRQAKESLNAFKMSRGCKIVSEPAFFRMNPLLLSLGKRFRKEDYKKLIGKGAADI